MNNQVATISYNIYSAIICCQCTGSETRAHFSEVWTDLVDRGGLIHISDTIFSFFAAMEVVVKSHYSADNPLLMKELKERIITDVLQDDDVLFHWSIVAANWLEEDAHELLKIIVDHWIAMRGFSFVSSFIEQYKREQKKTLEKSKGIRKNLISKSVTQDYFDHLAKTLQYTGKGTGKESSSVAEVEQDECLDVDAGDEDYQSED